MNIKITLDSIFKGLLTVTFFLVISFFFVSSVNADSACGPGSTCTGSNAYLKVLNCTLGSGSSCLNGSLQPNAPHSCPTGGGLGSCSANAPGKNGCNGNTQTPGTCTCSTTGNSCSGNGSSCGSPAPYNGTCTCGAASCGSPAGGSLGCCTAPGPYCGDGACNGSDTCSNCAADCGACGFCGNGVCGGSETCSNCASDCGACAPSCGDGICNGSETCSTCTSDCGACGPTCGDGICNCSETCNTCSSDCGNCVCVPSCSAPFCGQSNGCSSTCSNSDSGSPTAPTITPANGGTANVIYGPPDTVTITWTSVGKADEYDIELYPQGTSCANPNAVCTTVTTTFYSFTPASGVTDYTFRVRGVNTTCGGQNGTWAQSTFDMQSTITGTFYIDNGASVVGGKCTSVGATATSPGTGATIGAVNGLGSFAGDIVGNNYSITMPYVAGGTATVTLVPGTVGSDTYECACPGGCAYSVASPNSGVNYYLTPLIYSNEGWWQVVSGHTFASNATGTSITSDVPYNTCTDAPCIAAILTEDLLGTAGSAGIAVTGGGEIDSAKDPGANQGYVSERSPQAYVRGTDTTKFAEKYAFFYREYSLGLGTPSDDFTSSAADAVKPTAPPTGGKAAYFHQGDLTIRQRWTVTSSESIVVFVNGNLTIDDPSNNLDDLITVDPGGFLAFIVSGNVTIQPNVGNNTITSTTPNVEGVFIADGTITVASRGTAAGGDDRFVGAGNFIGWSGINLNRDFSDGATRIAENNDKPVEMFIFRPDFVRNLPEEMARPRYIWQETN